jgi:hypothetical protein
MLDRSTERKWRIVEVLILFLGVLAAVLVPLLVHDQQVINFNPTINVTPNSVEQSGPSNNAP